MKKLILSLCLSLTSVAYANDTNFSVEPGSQGLCSQVEHLGNWGYILTNMVVTRDGDFLNFSSTITNLVCEEPVGRIGEVAWNRGIPSSTPRNRTHFRLAGVFGFIHDADSFRMAQFSSLENVQEENSFNFSWEKKGLADEINNLQVGKALKVKFIFGLRASYKDRDNKGYYGFSGRYGVYLTLTKQSNGSVLIQRMLKREI